MNFRKLLTYLTVGTAAVIPFAGAQNPTILQGNYITNVFGNSNFVLNPNAQTNIANVTTVTATVTRSTTTPLVATSEFTVAIGTANGTATWATRTFDAGMKGQNCEARFSYRGFAATSKVHIKQGANTVASLTLTPATDPRIASINFPCGDLSQPTTFQVTDTAILGGVNEIGGIYVGLATNMANVAQAEEIGTAVYQGGTSCGWSKTGATTGYESFAAAGGTCNWTNTGSITPQTKLLKFDATLKPGKYQAILNATVTRGSGVNNDTKFVLTDGTSFSGTAGPYIDNTLVTQMPATLILPFEVTTTTSKTIELKISSGTAGLAGAVIAYNNEYYVRFALYRFPSSSELVVTPERQNVFGGIISSAASGTFTTSSATYTQVTGLGNFTAIGQATSTGSMQFTIPTMPAGIYRFDYYMLAEAQPSVIGKRADCMFSVYDGTTDYTSAYMSSFHESTAAGTPVQTGVQGYAVIKYDSVQTNKQFTVRVKQVGTGGSCAAYGANNYSAYFTMQSINQPSNSALYVQGPVQAAATGAAIPAGYVGEVKRVSSTGFIAAGASGVFKTVVSLALEAGVWMCQQATTTTCPALNCQDAFTGLSGTNNGALNTADGDTLGIYAFQTGWNFISGGTTMQTIRSTGSSLIFPDGSTSGSNILYSNTRVTYPSGSPTLYSRLMCTRIN